MKTPEQVKAIKTDDGEYGPLQICHSNAGYYIGRIFHNSEGWDEPGSRESDYYQTSALAQDAFDNNSFSRDAPEVNYMYDTML